jgi:hypothetical protein
VSASNAVDRGTGYNQLAFGEADSPEADVDTPEDAAELAALPAELSDLLERSNRSFLVTLRADGSPTAHPMTALTQDGALMFNTYRSSAKARNVARDARVSAVYLPPYDQPPRGVLAVRGRGEICGADEPPQRRGQGPAVSDSVARRVSERIAAGKRVLIEIHAQRVRPLAPPRKS